MIDMAVIRAFIAIELPEAVLANIDAVSRQLQDQTKTSAIRWVPARNIHLTLKFLGEVSPTNLEMLTKMLRAEVSRRHAFEVCVAGLGAFPTTRRPRVIWIGVEAPPELYSLQRSIESETQRLGYVAEERSFSPHLTLARFSHNGSPEEVKRVGEILAGSLVGEMGKVTVQSVSLFKSDLKPGGAVYTCLFNTPLLK